MKLGFFLILMGIFFLVFVCLINWSINLTMTPESVYSKTLFFLDLECSTLSQLPLLF